MPLLLLLSSCALDVELEDTAYGSRDLRAFNHVANPNPRPEIGQWGGCTATLIRPNWAVTASHCWGYFDGRSVPGVSSTFPVFSTLADGTHVTQSVTTDRTFAFTRFGGDLGGNDVMLAHLTSTPSLPVGIVPAAIASMAPAAGLAATNWGMGCTSLDGSGYGTLRALDTAVGASTDVLCPGDSGGPKVTGTWTTRGPIYGINSYLSSGGDGFGDAVRWKPSIDALITEWNAHGSEDIFKTGWCSGADERRYDIDANGDGNPDALCWSSSTGEQKLAMGSNRLIRRSTTALPIFCRFGRELLTGDFDGDLRTDLLCHDKTTGVNWIDFGRDGYNGLGGSSIATTFNYWCSHATAQLHTADLDHDKRTDLLCQDTGTGHKWVDYSSGTGLMFDGTDYESTNNFCSHVGAKLLVGDIDGNGYTDLICHTPSTGWLHLDRTYARDLLHGVDGWLAPTATDHFCQTGRVEVGDYDGDGRSDLKCLTAAGTWPSLYADSAGNFSYARQFGFGGDAAQRTVNASARPWSYER